MLKGLYSAYTGMVNEQHRMDTLTNNLANVATNGFKKEGSTSQAFDEVLAYKIKDTSDMPYLARNIGRNTPGVKIGENYTDYSQGPLRETQNTFDLAIGNERGFFGISFTNKAGQTSTKYTRDGAFSVDQQGYLVTKDGDFVQGTNGRIRLDPTQETTVDRQGRLFQNDRYVNQVQLYDFADYDYLEHYGENMYQPIQGAQMQAVNNPAIHSGYLETSNVQTVTEMVNLISVSRQYEANQKVIQTYDSSLEISVSQLGKLG